MTDVVHHPDCDGYRWEHHGEVRQVSHEGRGMWQAHCTVTTCDWKGTLFGPRRAERTQGRGARAHHRGRVHRPVRCVVTEPTPYQCRACRHAFYEHRESREWQLLHPRRKRNLTGCTHPGCACAHADDSHCQ